LLREKRSVTRPTRSAAPCSGSTVLGHGLDRGLELLDGVEALQQAGECRAEDARVLLEVLADLGEVATAVDELAGVAVEARRHRGQVLAADDDRAAGRVERDGGLV
jgi:hypothetical protein